MFRTAAKGEPGPANQSASTCGRLELCRKCTAPPTKNETAPRTHLAIPLATWSKPHPAAPPKRSPTAPAGAVTIPCPGMSALAAGAHATASTLSAPASMAKCQATRNALMIEPRSR